MADRKPRRITIEMPADIGQDCYADLAHGIWMLLKIANVAEDSVVQADISDQGDTLTSRWRSYEDEASWQ